MKSRSEQESIYAPVDRSANRGPNRGDIRPVNWYSEEPVSSADARFKIGQSTTKLPKRAFPTLIQLMDTLEFALVAVGMKSAYSIFTYLGFSRSAISAWFRDMDRATFPPLVKLDQMAHLAGMQLMLVPRRDVDRVVEMVADYCEDIQTGKTKPLVPQVSASTDEQAVRLKVRDQLERLRGLAEKQRSRFVAIMPGDNTETGRGDVR